MVGVSLTLYTVSSAPTSQADNVVLLVAAFLHNWNQTLLVWFRLILKAVEWQMITLLDSLFAENV